MGRGGERAAVRAKSSRQKSHAHWTRDAGPESAVRVPPFFAHSLYRCSFSTLRQKANEAYLSVMEARNQSYQTAGELEDLLKDMEAFLQKAAATPADIRKLVKECLDQKVSLSPEQIQDMSRQIQETIRSLSDIETILRDTENDKQKTNQLRQRASRVK